VKYESNSLLIVIVYVLGVTNILTLENDIMKLIREHVLRERERGMIILIYCCHSWICA
jgi:hypothetical protein